jgi:hypothetical protein
MNKAQLNTAANAAEAALIELDDSIYVLRRALLDASWAPQATRDGVSAQIETLLKIQNEIGPRLVQRIRDGDQSRIDALKDLLLNVDRNARETAQMLQTELTTGPLLSAFIIANYEDLEKLGRDAIKTTFPLALAGAAAVAVYLFKK